MSLPATRVRVVTWSLVSTIRTRAISVPSVTLVEQARRLTTPSAVLFTGAGRETVNEVRPDGSQPSPSHCWSSSLNQRPPPASVTSWCGDMKMYRTAIKSRSKPEEFQTLVSLCPGSLMLSRWLVRVRTSALYPSALGTSHSRDRLGWTALNSLLPIRIGIKRWFEGFTRSR